MEADADGTAGPGWTPPEEFEEYRLVRALGQGAMGQVYLARDSLLDRPVAVKFIAGADPDASIRERFFIEARAIARLSHPNVVAVHRVGEMRGRPYLISEFLRGQSLDQIEKPVPAGRALEIAIGLSRGLAAAHRQGVLHRDIKPANAMLTDEGVVKLLDFGLAKLVNAAGGEEEPAAAPPAPAPAPAVGAALAAAAPSRADATVSFVLPAPSPLPPQAPGEGMAETRIRGTPRPATASNGAELTSAGAIMGSPLYMAPEIWRAEPATRRSDIYSLGVLLYELCAGQAPFRGVPLQDLPRAAQERDAAPLLKAAPAVDPRLAAIIDRCVSRDPAARFDSGDALREALEQLLAGPRGAVLPEGNPYRGLQAFEAEHRALFFGRGADIRAILDRLRSQPFVLIAGDSGVGKSSLVRAGVIPALLDGELSPGAGWRVARMLPGKAPLAAMAAAIAAALSQDESGVAWDLASEDPGRALRRRVGGGQRLLVLVDQLEELCTLAEPKEAAGAARALASLCTPSESLRLLATARSDFLGRLAALPALGDELTRSLFLLRPLSRDGMREAVVGPALAKGVSFESDQMVGRLVAAAEAEGALPLLQFALSVLWDARDEARRLIPAEALERMGGVEGALARHADDVLEALLPPQRQAARRILTRLVTAEGTRARRTEAELATGADARAALDGLTRGRLIVAREGQDERGGTYEVAHEALISSWGTLRAWLSSDQEARAIRQRIERAAEEWERLGRTGDALLGAQQLAEAEKVDGAALSPREVALVGASRAALRRRRSLRLSLAIGVPLAIALVIGGTQLKARADLERSVDAQLVVAREAEGRARAKDEEARRLRTEAFALFDRYERAAAEDTWSRTLASAETADLAYLEAERSLETALRLDASRADVQALMGDVLLSRFLLAERHYRAAQARELRHRLSSNDPDGSRQRRLDVPSTVEVQSDPPGAEVRLHTYEEREGALVEGPPRQLGTAPLTATLPARSHLLVLTAPGRTEVRYPLLLERNERLSLRIKLPLAKALPEGFVYVPAGRFLAGSPDDEDFRRTFLRAPPLHPQTTGAFLVARREVTLLDWIAYLQALPAAERQARLPSSRFFANDLSLREAPGGRWQLELGPASVRYQALDGEPLRYQGRTVRVEQDWRLFPVASISADDARAYVRWLNATGRVPGARFCTDLEWERAARGADGRRFPSGNALQPDDANIDVTYGRQPNAFGPDEVGSHPGSRSPFGVDDMAGNVWEFAELSDRPGELEVRGGCWYMGQVSARSTNREVVMHDTRLPYSGLRLCADAP